MISRKFRVPAANPPVKARTSAVNSRLSKGAIMIDDECEYLIEDFEQITYKDNGSGDIDKSDSNRTHSSDNFGYLIAYEFPIRERVQTLTLRNRG